MNSTDSGLFSQEGKGGYFLDEERPPSPTNKKLDKY